MKTLKFYLLVLAAALAIGCNKDDGPENEIIIEEAEVVPELASISPLQGPKNTEVSIKGTAFGDDLTEVKVFFNGMEAEVGSVNDKEIKAFVPPRALTGSVKIEINGRELVGPEFNYAFSEAQVGTLAGNSEEGGLQDGQGSAALFGAMNGIAVDYEGNCYVAEPVNNSIRKISPEGEVTTLITSEPAFENGALSEAKISWPNGIVFDSKGNGYFTDTNNYKVRKISKEGTISTFAGSAYGYQDGPTSEARFHLLYGIAIDKTDNVYVTEGTFDFYRIRKISADGTVSTLAGGPTGYADGPGEEARFHAPRGLEVDASGNILVADAGNNSIRKISPTGMVTTLAGGVRGFQDGTLLESQFDAPNDLAIDALGNIYVADNSNMVIRKINTEGEVSTLAGSGSYGFQDGEGSDASLAFPRALAIDNDFNLFVSQNYVVRKIVLD